MSAQTCKQCYGVGKVPGPDQCPECCGIPESNCDGVTVVCSACSGTGRKPVSCSECAAD